MYFIAGVLLEIVISRDNRRIRKYRLDLKGQ